MGEGRQMRHPSSNPVAHHLCWALQRCSPQVSGVLSLPSPIFLSANSLSRARACWPSLPPSSTTKGTRRCRMPSADYGVP